MPDIRLATLSTVMLPREYLERVRRILLRTLPSDPEFVLAIRRVADALSSIATHTGVQAIACVETLAEAPSEVAPAHPPEIERLIEAAIKVAKGERFHLVDFLRDFCSLDAALDAVRPGWREAERG